MVAAFGAPPAPCMLRPPALKRNLAVLNNNAGVRGAYNVYTIAGEMADFAVANEGCSAPDHLDAI